MGQDGFTEVDPEAAEAIDAVRSVVREALERAGNRADDQGDVTWQALASAGLLALAVPEEQGGEGLGLAEVGVLLRETGARAIQVPVWETLCCGALTLAAAGSDEQRQQLLPGVASGDTLLTPALREVGAGIAASPTTTYADGTVSGRKIGVTYADRAARLLVTATAGDRAVVALVDPTGPGVELRPSSSSFGAKQHTVVLDGAPAELLEGDDAARTLRELAVAGLCLTAAGLVAGARDLTATYIKGRTQFGRSLAEFQAVAMQIADVYISSRTVDLAAANAAWRIGAGLDVTDDLAVAAYWVGHEGPAAMRTCHHLHGGMGVDVTYPMHRYFSWITDISHALGVRADEVRIEDPTTKNLELTTEQRALKAELREYFTGLADANERRDMGLDRHGETYQRVVRQMGADGWMGVGWPTEYGGHGLGEIEQTIFANEAQRADVHLPAVTLQTVGPTLIRYGTQKQKDMFLERILKGDVHFAIGYSEPDAGTDLASLRTRAVKDGDEFVINGQKMWTSLIQYADYVWLACRTDADAPRHKGLSILIVPTDSAGFSWTPVHTMSGPTTSATYYSDVRVPETSVVGELNRGWALITNQLNHERVALTSAAPILTALREVREWAQNTKLADGRRVIDQEWVQIHLARVHAKVQFLRLMNWRIASGSGVSPADASATKVFGTEFATEAYRLLMEVLGAYAIVRPGSPAAARQGRVERMVRSSLILTFGGGTNEVQRDIIGGVGLRLPASGR
ncbi:MAG: acyl-CoA dehydrogenase domain protein [Nocardioides sp.]|nr:acyl-CoA dehydrogenase domain protein [Nocardioides sp.]